MKSVKENCVSAISVLNAVITGYGCSLAVDVETTVTVRPSESDDFKSNQVIVDFSLIKNCIFILESLTGKELGKYQIMIETPFAPSKGLKTSSSVSTAVIGALNQLEELNLSIDEIVKASGEASLMSGVSITGALDDAYAVYCGGLNYTNNREQVLLSQSDIHLGLEILLLIPKSDLPKRHVMEKLQEIDTTLIEDAKSAYERGQIVEAIRLNTEAFGAKLIDDPSIFEKLSEIGGVVTGLNGTGPSMFILEKGEKIDYLETQLKTHFPQYSIVKTSVKNIYRGVSH